MRFSLLACLAFLGTGCCFNVPGLGGSGNTCTASTCNGCCDERGVCQPGNTDGRCGQGGGTCQACDGVTCTAQRTCPGQPLDGGASHDGGAGGGLKPNVLLLVDTSGSMNEVLVTGGTTTRIAAVKAALGQVAQSAQWARLGLVTYPTDAMCGSAATVAVDLPRPSAVDDTTAQSDARAKVADILNALGSLTPRGGTPTAASLRFAGGMSALKADDGRPDVVALITDGLPNCNAANPVNCLNASAYQCTVSTCGTTSGGTCTIGCLDQANTVAAINELRALGIRTAVVGLGTDLAGASALASLDAMASAGGLTATCPGGTDAECGGVAGACDPGTHACAHPVWLIGDAAALPALLLRLGQ